ncbi:unnamed protein product [Triticum turgidum subsp. durum]|uniref:Uncharacterized protein n=1 Tax=Triticum turgidum subsp. durum TaxID=4567 RepID=A0A9R1B5F9_TRITD|nr:unnamed protein product [Triticum turgidum subsp. durum]
MADAEAPAAKRLARAGSFSGVWWKLGDPAGDPAAVERRLRAVADEEAAVRARISRRHAGACGVRRGIAVASLAIEVVALVHAYWTARRRRVAGWSRKLLLLLAPPLLAVPASAAVVVAAFARLHNMFEARDEQRLRALVAERKAKIGQFRGSHHNMHKLIEVSTKYDPDAAAAATSDQPVTAAAAGRIKRSHSRLSFHIGDD